MFNQALSSTPSFLQCTPHSQPFVRGFPSQLKILSEPHNISPIHILPSRGCRKVTTHSGISSRLASRKHSSSCTQNADWPHYSRKKYSLPPSSPLSPPSFPPSFPPSSTRSRPHHHPPASASHSTPSSSPSPEGSTTPDPDSEDLLPEDYSPSLPPKPSTTSTSAVPRPPQELSPASASSSPPSLSSSPSPSPSAKAVEGPRAGQTKDGARQQQAKAWSFKIARKPKQPLGLRIFSGLVGMSAAPLGLHVPEPVTPLHRLDPRVKQLWLLALVILPARAPLAIRVGLSLTLILLTVGCLPRRLWQDQLRRLGLVTAFLFVTMAFGADGAPPLSQPRALPPGLEGLPPWPPVGAGSGYRYVVFKLWFLQLTRRGLSLAAMASSLSFIILQSANLCLATTAPEKLAAGLRWFLSPFARLGAGPDELVLTLLLSLRFVGIVFNEVRNLALGVVSRGLQWESLSRSRVVDIFASLFGRLFKNLFNHAENIALAMVARGYKGVPAQHELYLWEDFHLKALDWLALLSLGLLCAGIVALQRSAILV